MAHDEQRKFLEAISKRFSLHFDQASRVLEIGSQNINGTVRDFFESTKNYIGVDLGRAKDVDWIIPGNLLELPDDWADISISTECFEHCECWSEVFINMLRLTKPGGMVIVTCASTGRSTHGTIDSEEGSSPFTTSYYKNLGVDDLIEKISMGLYFNKHGFEINSKSKDLYFWGIRSDTSILESDSYWEDDSDRLARAQGQLAQAASKNSELQALVNAQLKETEKKDSQLLQARAEAEAIKNSRFWKITNTARKLIDRSKSVTSIIHIKKLLSR